MSRFRLLKAMRRPGTWLDPSERQVLLRSSPDPHGAVTRRTRSPRRRCRPAPRRGGVQIGCGSLQARGRRSARLARRCPAPAGGCGGDWRASAGTRGVALFFGCACPQPRHTSPRAQCSPVGSAHRCVPMSRIPQLAWNSAHSSAVGFRSAAVPWWSTPTSLPVRTNCGCLRARRGQTAASPARAAAIVNRCVSRGRSTQLTLDGWKQKCGEYPTRRRAGCEAPVPALSAGGLLAAALRTGHASSPASGSPWVHGVVPFHASACWTRSIDSCSWRLARGTRSPLGSAVGGMVHGSGIRAPR